MFVLSQYLGLISPLQMLTPGWCCHLGNVSVGCTHPLPPAPAFFFSWRCVHFLWHLLCSCSFSSKGSAGSSLICRAHVIIRCLSHPSFGPFWLGIPAMPASEISHACTHTHIKILCDTRRIHYMITDKISIRREEQCFPPPPHLQSPPGILW